MQELFSIYQQNYNEFLLSVGKKTLFLRGPLGPHLDGLMRGNRKNDPFQPSKEEFGETLSQLCPEENTVPCRHSTL
jgi:hypothetical protein